MIFSNDLESHKIQLLTKDHTKAQPTRMYLGIGVKRGVTLWNLLAIPFASFIIMQAQ